MNLVRNVSLIRDRLTNFPRDRQARGPEVLCVKTLMWYAFKFPIIITFYPFGFVAPHTGMNKKSVGLYVGASLGGMALLVVTTLLTVWCIRHRRLQRSFLNFTSSHYNSRTENATFGGGKE